MPSNFDVAFEHLIEKNIEGGYANLKGDAGGETKYGISKRSYPHLDIKSLTLDQAKDIYRTEWWQHSYDQMPPALATKVFTMAINTGAISAHKALQKAVLALGNTLVIDGIIGAITLKGVQAAVERGQDAWLLDKFKLCALEHYLKLSDDKADRGLPDFMRSWVRRTLA